MTSPPAVCSAADLLAIVPYQLGFHPQRSAVLVCLDERRRIAGMARVDGGPRVPPADGPEAAGVAALLGLPGAAVIVLGFDDAAVSTGPARDWLRAHTARAGAELLTEFVVRDGRWRHTHCPTATCCPPEGRAVPAAGDVPVIAEWVRRGVAPLPNRAAVAGQLEPGPRAADVARALESPPAEGVPAHPDAATAWEAILDPRSRHPAVTTLPTALLAAAALALRDRSHRDALICWLAPDLAPPQPLRTPVIGLLGRPPWAVPEPAAGPCVGDEAATHVLRCQHRLIDFVACLPAEDQVAALSVVAAFAWWWGDGALAGVALERALSIDATDSLAGILWRVVRLALRPNGRR